MIIPEYVYIKLFTCVSCNHGRQYMVEKITGYIDRDMELMAAVLISFCIYTHIHTYTHSICIIPSLCCGGLAKVVRLRTDVWQSVKLSPLTVFLSCSGIMAVTLEVFSLTLFFSMSFKA